MNKLASFIATCAGVGKLPKMPGTYGAMVALPFAFVLSQFGMTVFVLATIAVILIGVWAADNYAKANKKNDPQEVIIDEVAGQFIALWFASGVVEYVLAFILFRGFDILKPFPIGYLDKNIKGGLGIMVDDIVAGFFALLVLFVLQGWL